MSFVVRQRVASSFVVALLLLAPVTRAGAEQASPRFGLIPAAPAQSRAGLDAIDRDATDLRITKAPAVTPGGVRPLAGRLAVDLLDLAKAPAHATGRQWGKFALGLGLIGAVGQYDESLRTSLDPEVKSGLARTIRPIGQEGAILFLGASWALGRLADKPRAAAIGRDGFEATILASGIVAPLVKKLVGRERPRDGFGFSAFSSSSGVSFPSGEVTQAFVVASVVAAHSEKKWVKGVSWLLAGATAWQRAELDAHWGSDTVGGALLGAGIGRWVVRRNRERLWAFEPQLGEESVGLAVRRSF